MSTQSMNEQSEPETATPNSFAQGTVFGAAYERRLPEILAVKEEDLVKVILDVPTAVATVLGALREIRALREAMGGLSSLDLARVDGLEDYAEALAEANSRYVIATTPKEDIVALHEAALKTREVLRTDAHALAARGLIPEDRLTPMKGQSGYRNVAFELLDWANLLSEYVSASGGRLSLDELTEAKKLAERLVAAAGQRDHATAEVAEATRIRQQALTLLVDAYDEVRRAVVFLRWQEDDGETIAPSLYAAGRMRKRSGASDGTGEPQGPPADGNAPSTASPSPTRAPVPPASGTAPASVSPVPVGFPGANPFIS